jgi:tRNA1(Val) A37 N6-methylase TrmN6
MFVDETTRMLDPTCGSGTSLCAAESLYATQILGIEIDEDYAEWAARALEHARRQKRDNDGVITKDSRQSQIIREAPWMI